MAKIKAKDNKNKSQNVNPYKKVDSRFADMFRAIFPAPKNVSQAAAKAITGDARMSESSLSDKEKVLLYDVIQNAVKRTGKKDGGTEYADYGNLGHGSSENYESWFNRGKLNLLEGAFQSGTNPGFKLASTIGRGRYWHDEKNPNTVYYTDVYDWNPKEKNFKGSNAYQTVRNAMRATEDKNLNEKKNEMSRMNFKFDKNEIDKLRSKIAIDDEKFRD